MTCKHCGIADIPDIAIFCPACGKKLRESSENVTPRLIVTTVADKPGLDYVQAQSWWFKKIDLTPGRNEFPLSLTPDLGAGFRIFLGENVCSVDFTHFKAVAPFKTAFMFKNCTSLSAIDLSPLGNVSTAQSLEAMFHGCSDLRTFNGGTLDVSKVLSANQMFASCSNIEHLDFSGWRFMSLERAVSMFYMCKRLKSIHWGDCVMPALSESWNMFLGCANLESIDLSTLGIRLIKNANSMFDGCVNLKHIDMSGINIMPPSNKMSLPVYHMFRHCDSLETVAMYGCSDVTVDLVAQALRECGIGARILR